MKPIHLIAAAATLLATAPLAEDKPVLTIYTYDSFVSDWGPGPAVEAAFEETCTCDLQFVAAGDGAAVLSRLRLEGEHSEADIVLGLDTNLIAIARETGLFAQHQTDTSPIQLPDWQDETFLPFDFGHFAFVYDETRLPVAPASFDELINGPELSIIIQDPRSSTPGLGLVLWMKSVFGEHAGDKWAALAPRIVTVTKGWSEAYGMFLEGEADMVLSYTTSPAYHIIAEDDATKKAAIFTEGHYIQIEVAGIVAGTDQPELARSFMAFMLSPAFQSVIPTTNWMFPIALGPDELPEGYDQLDLPKKTLLFDNALAENIRKQAIEEWRDALSQ